MGKEVIAAIIVGLGLGLFITYGFYRVRTNLTETPVTDLSTPSAIPVESASPTVLSIHSPEDGFIQVEDSLTISGTTIPQSLVVVFVNEEDTITTADETGNFAVESPLEKGSNIISVHVIDENGETTVESRTVIVTEAFEEENSVASNSAALDS